MWAATIARCDVVNAGTNRATVEKPVATFTFDLLALYTNVTTNVTVAGETVTYTNWYTLYATNIVETWTNDLPSFDTSTGSNWCKYGGVHTCEVFDSRTTLTNEVILTNYHAPMTYSDVMVPLERKILELVRYFVPATGLVAYLNSHDYGTTTTGTVLIGECNIGGDGTAITNTPVKEWTTTWETDASDLLGAASFRLAHNILSIGGAPWADWVQHWYSAEGVGYVTTALTWGLTYQPRARITYPLYEAWWAGTNGGWQYRDGGSLGIVWSEDRDQQTVFFLPDDLLGDDGPGNPVIRYQPAVPGTTGINVTVHWTGSVYEVDWYAYTGTNRESMPLRVWASNGSETVTSTSTVAVVEDQGGRVRDVSGIAVVGIGRGIGDAIFLGYDLEAAIYGALRERTAGRSRTTPEWWRDIDGTYGMWFQPTLFTNRLAELQTMLKNMYCTLWPCEWWVNSADTDTAYSVECDDCATSWVDVVAWVATQTVSVSEANDWPREVYEGRKYITSDGFDCDWYAMWESVAMRPRENDGVWTGRSHTANIYIHTRGAGNAPPSRTSPERADGQDYGGMKYEEDVDASWIDRGWHGSVENLTGFGRQTNFALVGQVSDLSTWDSGDPLESGWFAGGWAGIGYDDWISAWGWVADVAISHQDWDLDP